MLRSVSTCMVADRLYDEDACVTVVMKPGVPTSPQTDPTSDAGTAGDGFIEGIAKHRHFARETDPPRV